VASVVEIVEVRCPVGPQRLFFKLRLGTEVARMIQPSNHLEISCSDCARSLTRRAGTPMRVFHRFNFAGELVQTVTSLRG
jgi:hypothetical protein